MTISSIAPVARGFRTAIPDASPARISALLYLSQAWFLGLTGRPFFRADFIVDVDAGTIAADESVATDVATVLTRKEMAAVKALASFYRHDTDDQLQALIKADVSWIVDDGHLREIEGQTVVSESGLRQTYALKSIMSGTAPYATISRDATGAEATLGGMNLLGAWPRA